MQGFTWKAERGIGWRDPGDEVKEDHGLEDISVFFIARRFDHFGFIEHYAGQGYIQMARIDFISVIMRIRHLYSIDSPHTAHKCCHFVHTLIPLTPPIFGVTVSSNVHVHLDNYKQTCNAIMIQVPGGMIWRKFPMMRNGILCLSR